MKPTAIYLLTLSLLLVLAATATATAPVASEVGILSIDGFFEDTNPFIVSNFTSADSQKSNYSYCVLYLNDVGVASFNSSTNILLDGNNGLNSSDYESPNSFLGAYSTPMEHGNTLVFDGSNDYAIYNISGNFNSSRGSMVWWQKVSGDTEFLRTFSWRNNATNLFEIKSFHNSTEVDIASTATAGTKSAYSQNCGVYNNDSKYHFYALTWDFIDDGNFTLYAGGKYCERVVGSIPIMGNGGRNASFAIGANSGTLLQNWKGNISQFMIVDYVMTAQHISDLYVQNRSLRTVDFQADSEKIDFDEGDRLIIGCNITDNNSQWTGEVNSSEVIVGRRNVNVSLNFNTIDFTSILSFGFNEKDNLREFINYTENPAKYLSNGITHIRYWIYNVSITSDICNSPWGNLMPTNGTHYDYSCMDKGINATLAAGATPYITFFYCPFAQTMPTLNDSQIAECALYVGNVTKRFSDVCTNGSWEAWYETSCGSFGSWKWDYLNEPAQTKWWGRDANYSHAYNETAKYIKSIVPGISFGPADMYDDKFGFFISNVTNTSLYDFLNYHTYNYPYEYYSKKNGMNLTYNKYYTNALRYGAIADGVSKPLYFTEFNLDASWNPVNPITMTSYGTAYISSAYYWLIKSRNVDIAYKFTGTGGPITSSTFGSWKGTPNFDEHPYFLATKGFARLFPYGSSIVLSSSTFDGVEVLGVITNSSTNGIVLINKRNASQVANVSLNVSGVSKWLNANATTRLYTTDSSGFFNLSLAAYEVVFLQNDNNLSVSIQNPSSGNTYYGSSFTLQSSVLHANPLSTCYYDFDGGGNVTMACNENVVIPFTSHGGHSIRVWASDAFDATTTSIVSFSSQTEQGGGGSSGGGITLPPANDTTEEEAATEEGGSEDLFTNSPVTFLQAIFSEMTIEEFVCGVGYKQVGTDCLKDTAFYQQNKGKFDWANAFTPRMPIIGLLLLVSLGGMILFAILKKR